MGSQAARLRSERAFFDRFSVMLPPCDANVGAFFESSTTPENRFILNRLGNLENQMVLDIGCGTGEAGSYFAAHGARCTAVDCSMQMLETTKKLALSTKLEVNTVMMDGLELDFPDDCFDVVYAANAVHHMDPVPALTEMRRVTKPGGKVCFWSPLRHNPAINVYRRLAKEVRTEHERPLDIRITAEVERLFSDYAAETFWILALAVFVKFYFWERSDLNQEFYWRKIVTEEKRLRTLCAGLHRADDLLKRIPFLEKMAWNIAVVATK